MITLYSEPLINDISIQQIGEMDTKANLLETFELLNVGIRKSLRKSELASILKLFFEQETAMFINILPDKEKKLLSDLLFGKQHNYVEQPLNEDKFLLLQKLHLVVTHEDKEKRIWHLYMPDNIRHRINDQLQQDITLYPELQQLDAICTELTQLRGKVQAIDNSPLPATLSHQEKLVTKKKLYNLDSSYARCNRQLQQLESQLQKHNIPLDIMYDDIYSHQMMIMVMSVTLTAELG